MNTIFYNEKLDQQLDAEDVVCMNMLDRDSCTILNNKILDIYHTHKAANEREYHLTTLINDEEYARKVWDTTYNIFNTFQLQHIKDYKIVVCNFIIKEPGGGKVNVHQDWSLCDESQHKILTIWCPLVDTNVQNGPLHVLPHSARYARRYIRGASVPHFYEEFAEELIPYHTAYNIGAGQAAIFEGATIHCSPVNTTDQVRVALQCVMIPKDAQLHYYRFHSKSSPPSIYCYHVPDDFYTYFFKNKEKYKNVTPDSVHPFATIDKQTFIERHLQL